MRWKGGFVSYRAVDLVSDPAPLSRLLPGASRQYHHFRRGNSPSPPSEGGEGWGEEGRFAYDWPWCKQDCAPLPARSSRGEGVSQAGCGGAVEMRPRTIACHALSLGLIHWKIN